MDKPAVLIAEGDGALRQSIKRVLCSEGLDVRESSDKVEFRRCFQLRALHVVIVGAIGEGAWGGLDLAREIRRTDTRVPLILLTASSSEELAIAALKAGVTDYFKSPVSLEELVARVRRCLAEAAVGPPPRAPRRAVSGFVEGPRMLGESPQMRAIKAYIGKVASTDSSVLITGETGTGKELAAELIHGNSARHRLPFVCINCAAMPDTLLESELFGHEKGAFTGAHALKEGTLKLADGGTAFFDEIGDMSSYAQAKVLRAIEGKEVQRLGGRGSIPLNVRVIAATNQDLEGLMAEGKFRKDLYFRLNVARIHLPPLRDRKEDIPLLLDHYIRELNARFAREVEGFTEEAFESLLGYEWPGNVRELRNLLEAVFISLHARRITFLDIPEPVRRRLSETKGLPQDERDRLLSALFTTNWNKSKAAQKLHWSRMTLYRKMAKHQVAEGRPGGGTLNPAKVSHDPADA